MLKLKKIKLAELDKNLRASVHKTGKLGFTYEAAKKLKLEEQKSADFATNEEDAEDTNFYLLLYPEDKQGDFKVVKAGAYFYINTKVLFDNLKVDYSGEAISFDIIPQEHEGGKVYALKKRTKSKKEKEEDENDINDLL